MGWILWCCQINTLQIFIRWVTQCAPPTPPAGFNTNTRMMLHQESGRITNLLTSKTRLSFWQDGSLFYNTAGFIWMSHSFVQPLTLNTYLNTIPNLNILQITKALKLCPVLLRTSSSVLPAAAACLSAGCWVTKGILGLHLVIRDQT